MEPSDKPRGSVRAAAARCDYPSESIGGRTSPFQDASRARPAFLLRVTARSPPRKDVSSRSGNIREMLKMPL